MPFSFAIATSASPRLFGKQWPSFHWAMHQLTCSSHFLDHSSQATTRPTFSTQLSHQVPSARPAYSTQVSHQSIARPTFNRQESHISTHSASGRPHPPAYHPTEPKKPKEKSKKSLLYRIAAQQQTRAPNPYYSNGTATSFNWRSGRPMAGMLEIERSRTRRERTFIGSECAVCEEPLEHTLRGERILQFSCGHVSHEACFYEYIKEFESQYCPTCNAPLGLDTSRGGNVLDLGNLKLPCQKLTSPADYQQKNSAVSSGPYPRRTMEDENIIAQTALAIHRSRGIRRPARKDLAVGDLTMDRKVRTSNLCVSDNNENAKGKPEKINVKGLRDMGLLECNIPGTKVGTLLVWLLPGNMVIMRQREDDTITTCNQWRLR